MSETVIPRLSGMLLIVQRKTMEELVGARVVTQALAKLPDKIRREYDMIAPLSWFPVEWFNLLVTTVAAEVGIPVLNLHAEITRTSSERTASMVWRVFLRLTSDEALLERTPLLYSRSCSQGELTGKVVSPGKAEVTLIGWPGIPDIQMQGLRMMIASVMKVAGRKAVKVTADRRPSGACFLVTWHP